MQQTVKQIKKNSLLSNPLLNEFFFSSVLERHPKDALSLGRLKRPQPHGYSRPAVVGLVRFRNGWYDLSAFLTHCCFPIFFSPTQTTVVVMESV